MPDLLDRLYCSEQIHIPPTFPYIMKLYCKAAIRTQPYDLLKWSAAYFRALANGEEPPAKERVEYPPYDSPSGLTPGYIRILINQFGKDPSTAITAQTLFKKWSDICLDEFLLIKLIALLGAKTTVNWVRFVGVCAGFISKTLTQTMILICELFTEEPEGGMATVPYDLFVDLYMFLAQMECGPLTEQEKAEQEAIMEEEDICEVAEKIAKGVYEEAEGEMLYAGEAAEEEGEEEEEICEERSLMGEKESRKGSAVSKASGAEAEESKVKEVAVQKEGEKEISAQKTEEEGAQKSETSLKEQESKKSLASGEGSGSAVAEKEEATKTSVEGEGEEAKEEEEEEPPPPPEPPQEKRILLEDLEESIRVQIEEKLAEEESLMDEEEREFEDLDSYLLSAAKRVHKFTADTLGFKIFRKYMRQEVPGIGPFVDTSQVEKVVDFMDSWSHKQEMMVMPRNIRHWMCPPLDKVPTPEP